MARTSIDDLVDEWGGVIFIGTCFVQILKIGANTYCALFFHDGNKVGNPRCVSNGVDKPIFVKIIDFSFYCLPLMGAVDAVPSTLEVFQAKCQYVALR